MAWRTWLSSRRDFIFSAVSSSVLSAVFSLVPPSVLPGVFSLISPSISSVFDSGEILIAFESSSFSGTDGFAM
jgi:hypothetical protein